MYQLSTDIKLPLLAMHLQRGFSFALTTLFSPFHTPHTTLYFDKQFVQSCTTKNTENFRESQVKPNSASMLPTFGCERSGREVGVSIKSVESFSIVLLVKRKNILGLMILFIFFSLFQILSTHKYQKVLKTDSSACTIARPVLRGNVARVLYTIASQNTTFSHLFPKNLWHPYGGKRSEIVEGRKNNMQAFKNQTGIESIKTKFIALKTGIFVLGKNNFE